LRITDLIVVEVNELDPGAMLYLAGSDVVKVALPGAELSQIVSRSLRKENVTGLTAIHHRCATLMPAPVTLTWSLTSTTRLTGPL